LKYITTNLAYWNEEVKDDLENNIMIESNKEIEDSGFA
jgi:hypothetical protein